MDSKYKLERISCHARRRFVCCRRFYKRSSRRMCLYIFRDPSNVACERARTVCRVLTTTLFEIFLAYTHLAKLRNSEHFVPLSDPFCRCMASIRHSTRSEPSFGNLAVVVVLVGSLIYTSTVITRSSMMFIH